MRLKRDLWTVNMLRSQQIQPRDVNFGQGRGGKK